MSGTSRVTGFAPVLVFLVLAALPQSGAYAADTSPPTGTIIINNGRSATNNANVTLALTWDDGAAGLGVSKMRFSDDGAHWSAWEALTATRAYTLPGGDGHKTVRVQFIDKANNRSAVLSDYILLDMTPPTGSIIIGDGALATAGQRVMLDLTWSDGGGGGVTRMRFSDNGSTWTAWEMPNTTRAYTLPMPEGYHTVRVQFLDGAGNYSAVFSDYIKLLTTETVLLPGKVPLVMKWIPGGTFTMGSPEAESGGDEGPAHSVTLSGFWMGKYELTKRQWQAVMGTAPWWYVESEVIDDLDSPAVCISWDDAQLFLEALNGYTGRTFHLPSEAQWEYACRAGTVKRFYWGEDPEYTGIDDYAWSECGTGQRYAHLAGRKLPNVFDLYDLAGNVWEFCEDDWHCDYVTAPDRGQAWVNSPRYSSRIIRGGSWRESHECCRSAMRTHTVPYSWSTDLGFRPVR